MEKPMVAMTLGDPAGVGPETVVGAWADRSWHEACRGVVVGHPQILERAVRLMKSPARVVPVSSTDEVESGLDVIPCWACGSDDVLDVKPGTIDPRGGQAAYDALVTAARMALAGEVDALTTAPLHKAALWQAGH